MKNIHLRYNNARILLVDDEPLVLDMFEAVLRSEGLDVICAQSSDKARNLLSKETFNVLLCDIWLDTIDGFAVAHYAKQRSENISVVLVTGRPNTRDEIQAESLGYQYLSKPVPFDMLRDSVFKAIKDSNDFSKVASSALLNVESLKKSN